MLSIAGTYGKVYSCIFPSLSPTRPLVIKIPVNLSNLYLVYVSVENKLVMRPSNPRKLAHKQARDEALDEFDTEFINYERIMDPQFREYKNGEPVRRGATRMQNVDMITQAGWREELQRMEMHPGYAHIHPLIHFDATIPAIFSEECHGTLTSLRRSRPELFELDSSSLATTALWKQIGREVCDAVDYMRTRGVVHIDMKTDNVLYTEADDGTFRFMVSDFGRCKKHELKNHFFETTNYFQPKGWSTSSSKQFHPMTLCVSTVAFIMVSCLHIANEKFPLFMHHPFHYFVGSVQTLSDDIERLSNESEVGTRLFPTGKPPSDYPSDLLCIDEILHYNYLHYPHRSNYHLLQSFRRALG
jgi:serine/threonine protein kinase